MSSPPLKNNNKYNLRITLKQKGKCYTNSQQHINLNHHHRHHDHCHHHNHRCWRQWTHGMHPSQQQPCQHQSQHWQHQNGWLQHDQQEPWKHGLCFCHLFQICDGSVFSGENYLSLHCCFLCACGLGCRNIWIFSS